MQGQEFELEQIQELLKPIQALVVLGPPADA